MKLYMSTKGITPLLSGTMILLISIISMTIIVTFAISYFDNLNDFQKYNNNKNNLSLINNVVLELKGADVYSYKKIYIDPTSKIEFNKLTNKIKIIQKIKNSKYYSKRKDSLSYGNLDINKTLNNFEFTLDLNGVVDINNSAVLNEGKQKIAFSVVSINDGVPSIRISRVNEGSWYDTNWEYRKRITIDYSKVEGDLENFPVLISITDDDLKEHTKKDGSDILFTLGDGKTKLYREIEDYNSVTGTLVAWVKIPEISSSVDSWIYIYYGNNSATENNNKEVWDENFVMVQHLNESPANDIEGHLDSTSYDNDGTPKNFNEDVNSTTNATGKIASGDKFDGINDYIIIPNSSDLNFDVNDDFSMSLWFNFSSFDDLGGTKNRIGMFAKVMCYGIEYSISDCYDDSLAASIRWAFGKSAYYSFKELDSWHKETLVFKGDKNTGSTTIMIYVDGEFRSSTTDTSPEYFGGKDNPIYIGASGTGGSPRYFEGSIDELRISNFERSSDWIKTEYNNQNDPNSFYTLSIEEIN